VNSINKETTMSRCQPAFCLTVSVWFLFSAVSAQADGPVLSKYLETGTLSAGISDLEKHLQQNGNDHQARFGLGVMQFLHAVEGLAQDHYRYGLLSERTDDIPLLRLPVPPNKNPQQISYEKAREALQDFVDDLAAVLKTLSQVDPSDVKLPIHFGRIRLDLNGDGQADESERFWKIYASFNRRVNEENGEKFAIVFDGGDVHWLRGYCHLLMAMGEVVLAHDWEDLFERTAHVVYPKVQSQYALLQAEGDNDWSIFLDAIAFIHLINFEVVAPEKLKSALAHLDEMTVQSRLSWKLIRAETDNDREWLPNPSQTGVIPNVKVTEVMISSWEETMAEMQAIFEGRKLLPYWRGAGTVFEFGDVTYNPTLGINLRRVFTEPTRLDLVLWLQGTAATPYLESYEKSGKPPVDGEVFDRMVRVFQGEFIGFAIWFN
jgi:hypothetical protein